MRRALCTYQTLRLAHRGTSEVLVLSRAWTKAGMTFSWVHLGNLWSFVSSEDVRSLIPFVASGPGSGHCGPGPTQSPETSSLVCP